MERVKVGQLWGEKTGINSNRSLGICNAMTQTDANIPIIVFDLFLVFFSGWEPILQNTNRSRDLRNDCVFSNG